MATEGGAKKALGARAMAAMMALTSAQQQDVRSMGGDGPSHMSDESSLAVTRPSPLDLPQRSYTTEPEAADDGTPGMLAEMQAQRRREEKMRETAEQFAGAPALPSVESTEEAPTTEERTERPQRVEEEMQEEAEESENMAADLSELDAERAKEAAEQQRRASLLQRINAQATADATAHRQKEYAKIYNGVTDLNGFVAFTGFNFMVYLAMSNAKMLNDLTFKNYDQFPKPSLIDKARTLFANLTCCLCSPSMCIWFIFACVIAAAVIIVYSAFKWLLG